MGNACVDEEITPLEVITSYKNHTLPTKQIHHHPPPHDRQATQIDQTILRQPQDHSLPASETAPPKLNAAVAEVLRRELRKRPLQISAVRGQKRGVALMEDRGVAYEGEWASNQPHGRGTAYYHSGVYFEGYFNQGQPDSKDCILILPDGSFYRGEIRRGQFEGQGIFESAAGTLYRGTWREGVPDGYGEESFPDGNSYAGNFVRGLKHGDGVFRWNDGKVYEGEFKNGKMTGSGKILKGEEQFQGSFDGNKKLGKAQLKTQFGSYNAQFIDGEIEGFGTFQWLDHTVYEGQFRKGVPHGKGTIKFVSGKNIDGLWENGKNVRVLEIRPRSRSKSRSKS